jgi:hypothetical protein
MRQYRMLGTLVVILRLIGLLYRGHRAVALEHRARRQQLAGLTRTRKRPPVRTRDRVFWVCLASAWRGWRTALVVVHPDTVVRWHRQRLRGQWTRRSAWVRPGRPSNACGHSYTRDEDRRREIRRDCLNHVVVLGEQHLRRVLIGYFAY